MAETLKEKTAKGLFWGGLSNGVQQVLNLIFGIFLARMLSQSDYGMVGMLTVFSAIANSLQEGGFISALNRKKNVTHKDYNAVFWTTTLVSIFFYSLLFLCAPLIAVFYGIQELKPLARYTFLSFFISSIAITPRAYMFRNMMIRETTVMSVVSLLVSGFIGVFMAANGFAYWGLATQTIVYVVVVVIFSFYYSRWRPTLPVDFTPVKEMIGFSSKLIVTNIFYIINNNIFSVLLGRMYSAREVGNYTQANKWNTIGHSFVSNMLGGIAQPVFAKTDEDKERQKRIFRKLLRFTAFISFPAMFGLALVAKEFIVILLTEKWLESAQIMQMLCVAGAFIPISGLFSNLIISRGHSTIYMWCSILLCLVQLLAVFFSASYGIDCMILVYVVINIVWLFVWHIFVRKEIGLTLREMMQDVSPYFLLSLAIIIIVYLLTGRINNLYFSIGSKIVLICSFYCSSLWLLDSKIFKEIITYISHKKIEI